MEIVRIKNAQYIQQFVQDSKLYERLSEDGAVPAQDWIPNLHLSIWLLAYELDGNEIDPWGLFAFVPETRIVWRFHPAIPSDKWGNKKNIEAGKLALQWVWKHSEARKLVGKAPALYPDLLKWAQRIGMSREGVQRKSYLKNGELHDQYYMGISRPE